LLGRLALLFVVIPLLELYLLIQLGQWVGLGPTLALVVATGLGGAVLARREGWRAFRRFGAAVARGEVPTDAALDGLAVLVGGAFLLTPGVLTDVVGFGLLLPPVRALFKRRVVSSLKARVATGGIQFLFYGPAAGAWMSRHRGPGGSSGAPGEEPDRASPATSTESAGGIWPPPRPGEIVIPPPEGDDT
jgi:UPF0716 protein FxsA